MHKALFFLNPMLKYCYGCRSSMVVASGTVWYSLREKSSHSGGQMVQDGTVLENEF